MDILGALQSNNVTLEGSMKVLKEMAQASEKRQEEYKSLDARFEAWKREVFGG